MALPVKAMWIRQLNYRSSLQLQTLLANRHHDQVAKNCNVLLMCEHNPVYTVGIRDKSYTAEDESKLTRTGADFCRTNRGGLITFHGPGQLVAYPIINLRDFKTNLRCYVSRIEKMVIRICAEYGIKAGTTSDTGIWIGDRKICAIGIHASRYVTTHGLALNCNTDLQWFDHIVPCGLEGKTVTSITNEIGTETTVKDVLPFFKQAFQDEFNCSLDDTSDGEIHHLLQSVKQIMGQNHASS